MKELEKKIAKWGSQEQIVDEELAIKKKCSSDKVIRNLNFLIKKIESDTLAANEEQKTINSELKILNSEIESYNKQLMELEGKEREILKTSSSGGAESRRELKELQKANNAMKSAIH